jgi:hypothetical protein
MAKLPWIGLSEEVEDRDARFLPCSRKEAAGTERKAFAAVARVGTTFGRANALTR